MKACIRCGAPLEDHANFCNHCGSGQQAASQPQPAYPQYQQPYPQYQQPYTPYAPNPAQNFVPKFGAIALFHFLAALLVNTLSSVVSALATLGGVTIYSGVFNWLLKGFYGVVYVLILWIGFSIYNKKCVRAGYPQKKLPFLCVGIPLVVRSVLSFLYGLAFAALVPMLYMESGMPVATLGLLVVAMNWISLALNAILTWFITLPILKAIVKKR